MERAVVKAKALARERARREGVVLRRDGDQPQRQGREDVDMTAPSPTAVWQRKATRTKTWLARR